MPKKKSAPVKPSNHNFQVGPFRISPILILIVFLILISLFFFGVLKQVPLVPGVAAILAGLLLIADGVRNGLTLKTLGFPALGVFLTVFGIYLTFTLAIPAVVIGALAVIAAVLLFLGVKRRQSNIFSMFTLVFWLALLGFTFLVPAMLQSSTMITFLGLLPLVIILLIFSRR